MRRLFSYEFTRDWSWSLVIGALLDRLADQWDIVRAFPETDLAQLQAIQRASDVTLCQHMSGVARMSDAAKVVTRIGGIKTFNGDYHRFDKDLSSVYAVIATNRALYDIAARVNPRVYLIPNGLDLEEWAPVRLPGRSGGRFVVGFAANITPPGYREYKGYDLVHEAARQLRVRVTEALFGVDQLPHDTMRERFYRHISVLVHPTAGEGCSNVIMEALACGVPVITTREAGYHGEMLRDGVDAIFCERTAMSVMAAIKRVMCNDELRRRLSLNGRKFAEAHHDIRPIAAEYQRIFDACVEHNRALRVAEMADRMLGMPDGSTVNVPNAALAEMRALLKEAV